MATGIAYETKRLDHLGIVTGICREIGLAEVIDQQISSRKLSLIAEFGR